MLSIEFLIAVGAGTASNTTAFQHIAMLTDSEVVGDITVVFRCVRKVRIADRSPASCASIVGYGRNWCSFIVNLASFWLSCL